MDAPKTETKQKKGREHYSSEKLKARRRKKRDEADARQALHDGLTTQEKLNKARKRGGSTREIDRLIKQQIQEEKSAPVATPKVTESTEAKPLKKKKVPYQKPKRS